MQNIQLGKLYQAVVGTRVYKFESKNERYGFDFSLPPSFCEINLNEILVPIKIVISDTPSAHDFHLVLCLYKKRLYLWEDYSQEFCKYFKQVE